MTSTHGFELLKTQEIPELNATASLYKHIRTGAEVLSVETDDENKSFCAAFKTPPSDDTGLPHILEHSVLNGSRKYPVREPFVELLKTSMQTFLNAMTTPDVTVYPVASTNLQDFYNLVDVYLDAVFYPLITEDILQQEGWHHEVDEEQALTYKGVVFNEMKGYYSVPEIVLEEETRAALMPDTPYANSYGGDPAAIPNLTYEQFKNFHSTYYHPSNARIFFYGDDDPQERLRLINEFIADFEAREIDSTLPLQPRFTEARTVTKSYDAGDADADSDKHILNISWLMNEVTDLKTHMALEILNHILVETSASPLRKALIDSGLGEDITGHGYDVLREGHFTIGLKGIAPDNVDTVESLIIETLSNLADGGIDKATIEASLNTTEFQMRERNTGGFPQGLATFFSIMHIWAHGGDPIEAMAFEDDLNAIKKAISEDDSYFENLIGEHLLDNPHRVTVRLVPDTSVKTKREAAEKARLEEERAAMTEAQLSVVIEQAKKLQELQNTPDSPEDIAKLPVLTLDDLERKIKTVDFEKLDISGSTVLYHDLPTSGIAYLDLGFNLYALPTKYLPWVKLFGRMLTEMGTTSQTFVQLLQRIGAQTGGIRPANLNAVKKDRSGSVCYIMLRAKAMHHQIDDMLAILKDILLTVNLDNPQRLLQMAREEKARMEQFLGLRGQATAAYRLQSAYDDAGYITEQINGVSNLIFTRELISQIENDWETVRTTLEDIRNLLINRNQMIVNVTAESGIWQTLQPQLETFIGELPANDNALQSWHRESFPKYEAFAVPTQVNFVGMGLDLYSAGYEPGGSQVTVFKYLNFGYLWNLIRVQGGAYGGRAMFNHLSGVVSFLSWQDPNLLDTLRIYSESAAYLQNIALTSDEMEKAIIGAIGEMDNHSPPDAKGYQSLIRHLTGYTDDLRQQARDEVFATTNEDFHRLGAALEALAADGRVVVTSWKDKLQSVNAEAPFDFDIKELL